MNTSFGKLYNRMNQVKYRSFRMLRLKMKEQAISYKVWLTMLTLDYYHLI